MTWHRISKLAAAKTLTEAFRKMEQKQSCREHRILTEQINQALK
jgi:hypothetical protein